MSDHDKIATLLREKLRQIKIIFIQKITCATHQKLSNLQVRQANFSRSTKLCTMKLPDLVVCLTWALSWMPLYTLCPEIKLLHFFLNNFNILDCTFAIFGTCNVDDMLY